MAATGLLGVNPYYKGTALDVSKPVNLAIQLHQKEEAKKEALDKYFMDYEKSLNPAGMRTQDQDVFLKKLAENKAYYLRNREKILNPSKYGAEAQSEYMSGFKNILSDIEKSKQLAGTGKVIATALMDAKKNNRTIPKEVADAIYNNELSIGDPNHISFDPINFDAYDKHDPTKYQQSIYSKIKPTELPGEKVWNKSKGEYEIKVTKDITKDALNQIGLEVNGELQKDRGLQDTVKSIMMDQNKMAQVAQAYKNFTGKDMKNNPTDVAIGYTIALKPQAQTDYQKYDNWKEQIMFKENYENNLVKNNFKGALSDLIKASEKSPKLVYNEETGKNETWNTVPLTGDVKKNFTVPYVEKSYIKNTDYDPNDPNSEEFIIKPGTKTVQKEVDYVLKDTKGNLFGYVQPVDNKGNKIPGKFEKVAITKKDLAKALVKDYVSEKNLNTAVNAALEGQETPSSKPTTTKKEIKSSEIASKAAASGYTEKEYRELLKANGIKIIN
jgi:hypothetical protein